MGAESSYLLQALESGHWSGDGPWTKRCQSYLEENLGVQKCLITTSCTHALEMCALLLDLQPGDEVIVPAFTFATSVNAFVLHGATPVFVDILPETLNIDPTRIEAAITPRTRAIVVVHYAGVSCDMDAILAVAGRHEVMVIEDNAHGLFGSYHGRPLGTFGSLATLSFHETKNFSCGEGGALLINDPGLASRAEIIREKGTDRSRFFRGLVDKYTWVDVGSSYLPSDLLAAVLYAQLERRTEIQAHRQGIWEIYRAGLDEWAGSRGVVLPTVPDDCAQSWHLFYALFPSLEDRQRVMAGLKHQGILAVFHYLPLHLSPMGVRFGGRPGQHPVTETTADRLLRLPLFNTMTFDEARQVVAAVRDAF